MVVGASVIFAASAALTLSVITMHLTVRPVLTGSMQPDYGPGAAIVTKSIPVRSVRPGMIVLFVPPGKGAEYAHRVTSVTGSPAHPIVTTKGDANKTADPWHIQLTSPTVPEVVASVPGLGRVMVFLQGPLRYLVVILGGLAVAIGSVRWASRPRRTAPRSVIA